MICILTHLILVFCFSNLVSGGTSTTTNNQYGYCTGKFDSRKYYLSGGENMAIFSLNLYKWTYIRKKHIYSYYFCLFVILFQVEPQLLSSDGFVPEQMNHIPEITCLTVRKTLSIWLWDMKNIFTPNVCLYMILTAGNSSTTS